MLLEVRERAVVTLRCGFQGALNKNNPLAHPSSLAGCCGHCAQPGGVLAAPQIVLPHVGCTRRRVTLDGAGSRQSALRVVQVGAVGGTRWAVQVGGLQG
jgi:hypothetical protein